MTALNEAWQTGNTAFPHQPGYTRPDRADDLNPADHVEQIRARIGTDPDPVVRAYQTVKGTAAAAEKYLTSIDVDRYSQKGLSEKVAQFEQTSAYAALDHAFAEVEATQARADANVAKVLADLSPDGDTAAELRASRYWDRTRRLLDGLPDTGKASIAARDLVAKANRTELGTLLQELGPYLQSRHMSPDWIDPMVAEVVPEYKKARDAAKRATQAVAVTRHNVDAVKRHISSGSTQWRQPKFVDPAVL